MPPRWFVRTAWVAHRALFRGTGGRRGLWPPKPGKWGTMRLVTVGRKTGKEREAIVAYFEDGPNIVTMAMNGWGEGEPAWWLNLLDHPDAEIELKGEGRTRAVRGRAAVGEERDRLWESGAATRLISTATRPCARPRRRSSSSSRGLTRIDDGLSLRPCHPDQWISVPFRYPPHCTGGEIDGPGSRPSGLDMDVRRRGTGPERRVRPDWEVRPSGSMSTSTVVEPKWAGGA